MKLRRGCKPLAVLTVLSLLTLAPQRASADDAASDQVVRTAHGGEVVKRGEGCSDDPIMIHSGRIDDPTPGLVSTLNVEVGADCAVTVTSAETGLREGDLAREAAPRESLEVSDLDSPRPGRDGSSTDFEPNTVYGNYIRSSQTLQDVINIDIAKLKWTHDRIWDTVYDDTRFRISWEVAPRLAYWGQASTSVSWNHPVSVNYVTAMVSWSDIAWSVGTGAFHSDFLWCNFEPGQNFEMTTQLWSFPDGAYDANFYQSRTCSFTHMATSKSTSTSAPPY